MRVRVPAMSGDMQSELAVEDVYTMEREAATEVAAEGAAETPEPWSTCPTGN